MKIELCIPAFNEERIIAEAARAVLHVFREARREVVITVADNASTDATGRIAQAIDGVAVLSIPVRGKGAAVIAAARACKADTFGFIDADLSAEPVDVLKLLSFVENGTCDIAIGSRLIDTSLVDRGVFRTLGSKLFNLVRKNIVGVKAEDTQCGLKLMNARGKEILAECEETGWFFDIEFLARAERAGLRIREVPIHWREQRFPGRKSNLKLLRDSVGALRAMFRIRRQLGKNARVLDEGGYDVA